MVATYLRVAVSPSVSSIVWGVVSVIVPDRGGPLTNGQELPVSARTRHGKTFTTSFVVGRSDDRHLVTFTSDHFSKLKSAPN